MADPCCLIGDIGGTYARFALANPEGLVHRSELTVLCRDYKTAELAIFDYLERIGLPVPKAICLAAAGPVADEKVVFTNNHWSIDRQGLSKRYPAARIRLLNDFEAIACSIPLLKESDLLTIGPEPVLVQDKINYTVGVLGPGTGLGMAGLVVREDKVHPVVSEGGHVGFAPENPLQSRVLEELRKRFGHVSDERLLSGPGHENIYRALCAIHGELCAPPPAPEIFRRAQLNQDLRAGETLDLFYEVLGQVAGNLALTLGAYDGIYIAGGIVKRYPELIESSHFRRGFENKGRYRTMMEKIPTLLIMHPQPGLLGAAFCARQMVCGR